MKKPQIVQMLMGSTVLSLLALILIASEKKLLQANPANQRSQSQPTPWVLPSLTSEQLEQLSEDLADVTKQANDELAKQYRPCGDHSNAYLKLPLRIVDPAFKLCAVDLLQRTQVPAILPPKVPKEFGNRQLHPYFYLPLTNTNRYNIGLTWLPGEYYQASVAYFEGEKLTSQSPPLLAIYEEEVSFLRSPLYKSQRQESGRVNLARGMSGYYIAAACGVNCHSAYSSVIWEQQGFRYRIAIKLGRKSDVLKIANTAIQNQQANP
jgi:hypothetical protein